MKDTYDYALFILLLACRKIFEDSCDIFYKIHILYIFCKAIF